jgi:hypothetical protein
MTIETTGKSAAMTVWPILPPMLRKKSPALGREVAHQQQAIVGGKPEYRVRDARAAAKNTAPAFFAVTKTGPRKHRPPLRRYRPDVLWMGPALEFFEIFQKPLYGNRKVHVTKLVTKLSNSY